MSGTRPFPVSRHVLDRLPRHPGGNLVRGPGCGGGWVVDCILFYFLVWCVQFPLSFFVLFCWFYG